MSEFLPEVYTGRDLQEAVSEASKAHPKVASQLQVRLVPTEEAGVSVQVAVCPPGEAYAEQIQAVRDMTESLLHTLDISTEVHVSVDHFRLNLSLSDAGRLERNQGQPLSDLETLLGRYHSGLFSDSPLVVTLDHPLLQRRDEDEVVERALAACQKLSHEGDSILLDPMNSYERRLVHVALQNYAQYQTESVGDGSLKRIQVSLVTKGEAS
ncbi:MAG: hypothetical protein KDC35_09785 [Acidobacteria bacterium]|nr:hypothetical protein [Acidobacteriota bacterium]